MSPGIRLLVDVALLTLAIGLCAVILSAGGPAETVLADLDRAMPASGVKHPVTAVLLNFRGYDTLLEMLVLLLTVVSVRSLAPLRALPDAEPPSPVLVQLLRLLAPLLVLIAAYLLWRGSSGPGGAFQAAAVLSAAGVLWLLTGPPVLHASEGFVQRLLVSLGVTAFAVIGVYLAFVEGAFLAYPRELAGMLIFSIEVLASVSIAVTLVLLFIGVRSK